MPTKSQFQFQYKSLRNHIQQNEEEISAIVYITPNLELNFLLLMERRIEKSGLPGLKKQQKVRDGIEKRQLDYLLLRFHRVAAKFVKRERERE